MQTFVLFCIKNAPGSSACRGPPLLPMSPPNMHTPLFETAAVSCAASIVIVPVVVSFIKTGSIVEQCMEGQRDNTSSTMQVDHASVTHHHGQHIMHTSGVISSTLISLPNPNSMALGVSLSAGSFCKNMATANALSLVLTNMMLLQGGPPCCLLRLYSS